MTFARAPSNGGKLVAAPRNGPDDPATLTDGWRHGAGKMWASAANPNAPVEFLYEFAAPVTIEKVQLHQHTAWPSKEVEVLASEDGTNWHSMVRGELPAKHPAGPNYAFLLKKGLNAPARRLKARILSGYQSEHWGLGEIEVFGRGAIYTPDDDWFHVNVDLVDLAPGQTIHDRLAATNAQGTAMSSDQTFTLPSDAKPQVVTGPASRMRNGAAKVEGRLNPLGKKTPFYFEYGPTKEYGQKTSPRYGGLQISPRIAFDTLTG